MYYLDNAATTKVNNRVADVMNKYNIEHYFNPSSVYLPAVNVKKDIEKARGEILDILGASQHNLLFVSCATEANNTIFSSVNLRSGDKVLISAVEHPSVYNKAISLREKGIVVELINVKSNGEIDLDDLKNKLDKNVKLVSVMHVCNETGVIHNIKSIVKTVKSYNKNIIVACDGVQAFGKIDVCLDLLDVDFYVISAHKIHGPKGIGALIYKKSVKISPIIIGGGQENNLRSGTENVSSILGLCEASKIAFDNLDENYNKVKSYKTNLIEKIFEACDDVILNGEVDNTSPYIISLSINGIRGEVLLHMLEKYDIYISTGSACSSKHYDNRILESLGRSKNEVMGSIRISFNAYDEYDIDYIADKIISSINELKRKIN